MAQKIPAPYGNSCSESELETPWRATERLGFPTFPKGLQNKVLGFQKVTFFLVTSLLPRIPMTPRKSPVFLYTREGFPPIRQHQDILQIPHLPLSLYPVFGWSTWHLLNGWFSWTLGDLSQDWTECQTPDPQVGPCDLCLNLWI